MITKRRIFGLIIFLFLVASIPLGLYLVKHPQTLKAKADSPYLKIEAVNGTPLTTTTNLKIAAGEPITTTPSVKATLIQIPPAKAQQNPIPYIMQGLLYKDGHYEERRCPKNSQAGWGVDLPEAGGRCTLIRSVPGVANDVQDLSMFTATYKGQPSMFQALFYKDGHYEERRCPLDTNQKWGIQLQDGGTCTLVRSIPGVADVVHSMTTFTATYKGQPSMFQAIFYKDGHYEERRCPLNDNAGWGVDLPEAGGRCTLVRSIPGVANVVEDESSFVAEYNNQKYMMQGLLYKDGHYEERRCPLNDSAPWGVDMPEAGGMCTLYRSVPNLSSIIQGFDFFEASYVNQILPTYYRISETYREADTLYLPYTTSNPQPYEIINLSNPGQAGSRFISADVMYNDGSFQSIGPVEIQYQPPVQPSVQPSSPSQPQTSPQSSPQASVQPTPSTVFQNTPALYTIPVLVLKYFPLKDDGKSIDNSVTGDVSGDLTMYETRTDNITKNLQVAIAKASQYHGYKDPSAQSSLGVQIVDTKEFKTAVPIKPKGERVTYPDYKQIMLDQNICDYVDNKGVREVWVYAYQGPSNPAKNNQPYLSIDESKMGGPQGDISNSFRYNDLPTCQHTYRVLTYNYGRGTAEALHSWGHQLENELSAIDANLFGNLWEGPNYPQTLNTNGRCGSIHNPPNARFEYDYDNPTPQNSDCMDWNPDSIGTLSPISCLNWGCDIVDDSNNPQLNYLIWELQNLPGYQNTITYKGLSLRNFWEVHANFDDIMTQSKYLTTTPPPVDWSCGQSCSNGCAAGLACSGTGICIPIDRSVNHCADNVLPHCGQDCTLLPCAGGLACDGNSRTCLNPRNPTSSSCFDPLPTTSPTPSPSTSSSPVPNIWTSLSINNQLIDLSSIAASTLRLPGSIFRPATIAIPIHMVYPDGRVIDQTINFDYNPGHIVGDVGSNALDINHDGVVNSVDVGIVLKNMGAAGGPGDVNQDGVVNSLDYSTVERGISQ